MNMIVFNYREEFKMKGYKVFNSDWTCRGYQYEIGKTYEIAEHPPGKYLLLDKDDLRKLTELFKRVYQEGEYIDMNDIKEFLTKEHKELIHKKIVKTIEDMDFTSIIEDFINDELDYVRDRDNVDEFLEEQIIEIVRQHLVKSGLLKENK